MIVTSEAAGKLAFGQDGAAHFRQAQHFDKFGHLHVLELKVKTFQWPAFRQLRK